MSKFIMFYKPYNLSGIYQEYPVPYPLAVKHLTNVRKINAFFKYPNLNVIFC